MKMTRKVLALLLAMLLALPMMPAFAENSDPDTAPYLEELPIYYFNSTIVDTIPVVFFDGNPDIPYCSVKTFAYMVQTLFSVMGDYGVSVDSGYTTYSELEKANILSIADDMNPDTQVGFARRENGSIVLFDFENNLLWMSDMDLFVVHSYAVSGGDIVSGDGLYHIDDETIRWDDNRDEAVVNLYKRVNGNSTTRQGDVTSVYLSDYNIFMEHCDSEYYIPVATVSDLFMAAPIAFNGESFFACYGSLDNTVQNDEGLTMRDLYYRPGPRERSEALAIFTYDELCLMLDNFYGLKEEHDIKDGFNNFFISTGLADGLYSTDPGVFTNALDQLLRGYFGDMHSGMDFTSSYAGSDYETQGVKCSISIDEYFNLSKRFTTAREQAGISVNEKVVDGYSEIGDTAFVTFDSFDAAKLDYYDQSYWDNFYDVYMTDTISLVVYAHSMIRREGSPIRKVVIDLSCNGGGALDACIFIASWVLGSANLSIENTNSGAQYTTVYWIDTNLDGVCGYDDELDLENLDVYCLVNGTSFSCGNLLPTLFKQDGRVTLIGQTTGGGACTVRPSVAADGTLFSISSNYRLSLVKNGSFYSIDRGVEPDIPLRKPASFYDREALVEFLDTIR